MQSSMRARAMGYKGGETAADLAAIREAARAAADTQKVWSIVDMLTASMSCNALS